MKWFIDILTVWRYEFKRIIHDEGVLVFFLAVPLLYPLLYSYLYNNEIVTEVPAVVVNDSHSSLSREFIRKVDATADIRIVAQCADMEEAKEMLHRNEAYAIVYIPSSFDNKLSEGQQATINVYSDMSGFLYYKAIYSACVEVSLDMNSDIKAEHLNGATDKQIKTFSYPIEYRYVPMFNTQSGFASFLIPAVLILIIQQTMVLGVGMLAGDERERIKKGKNIFSSNDNKPIQIVLGRAGAYWGIYAIISAYLVCLIPLIFNLVHIWQWKTLLPFMSIYITACVFFSMTLSILSRDRESLILVFVFMSIPLLFMSGLSWPVQSMPLIWKTLSHLFPSTFGITGYIHISEMGAVTTDIHYELIALCVQSVVYFITTCILYRRRYRKTRFALNKELLS